MEIGQRRKTDSKDRPEEVKHEMENLKMEVEFLKTKVKELDEQMHDKKSTTITKQYRKDSDADETVKYSMHEQEHSMDVGYRDKLRKKPKKSQSFQERSASRTRRRSPFRHTVPSDKG